MSRIESTVLNLIDQIRVPQDAAILELAPGEGNLTRNLVARGYRGVEAIDMHPENFRVPGVKCRRGDLNDRLPFPDRAFDVVISVECIEHLEHQYRFAAEINRVLKDNGVAVITTPNINNFASRLRFLFTGFYSLAARPSSEFEKNWIIEHIYPLTFWQLRHILHTNGLMIERIETDKLRRWARIGEPLRPLCYLATWLALRKEPDQRQRERNLEILRQLYSPPMFLGRTQVVVARKRAIEYARKAA